MKLPVISGRELVRALEKAGFRVVRQKGSHVRLEKRNEEVIKITVPLHRTLKKGTLRIILRQAGLTVEELLELL